MRRNVACYYCKVRTHLSFEIKLLPSCLTNSVAADLGGESVVRWRRSADAGSGPNPRAKRGMAARTEGNHGQVQCCVCTQARVPASPLGVADPVHPACDAGTHRVSPDVPGAGERADQSRAAGRQRCAGAEVGSPVSGGGPRSPACRRPGHGRQAPGRTGDAGGRPGQHRRAWTGWRADRLARSGDRSGAQDGPFELLGLRLFPRLPRLLPDPG